jgi:hypothetical protein
VSIKEVYHKDLVFRLKGGRNNVEGEGIIDGGREIKRAIGILKGPPPFLALPGAFVVLSSFPGWDWPAPSGMEPRDFLNMDN